MEKRKSTEKKKERREERIRRNREKNIWKRKEI
jgi:hypothetical protein